jgi:Mg2+/Co2+ transporter CorC
MTEAGHVLKPGEKVSYDGLEFQIERVERRRVMCVKLELPEVLEQNSAAESTSAPSHS